MRLGIGTLAFLLVHSASAQIPTGPFSSAVGIMRERGVLQGDQQNPLAPKGNPPLPPKHETLPEPVEQTRAYRVVRTGQSRRRGNTVSMTGGTEFFVRGYHVFADEAEGDLSTNVFTLTNKVRIIGTDTVITGEKITVDFNNRSYRSINAESQLTPQLVKGKLKDNLYVRGEESFGTARETHTHNGGLTTCNLEHPHYEVEAVDTNVRTGRRAIFRKARLRAFGKTILNIPFLSVPLDDRTYRYLPDFGQSRDEGYYVKSRYGIPLRGDNNFDARVDYMSKLGSGLGGDYVYNNANINGVARLYKITGPGDSLVLSNQHRQQFRFGTLSVDNDFQQNNYLTAPGSTLLNTRANLVIPQGDAATTTLGFNRNGNQGSGFESENRTITLTDDRRFGRRTSSNIDLSWLTNRNVYTGSPSTDNQEVDVRFRANHDLERAVASLEYQRNIPIGDNPNFFSGSDRTPVLSLESDSRRLFGRGFDSILPFRTQLSFGEFHDARSGQINRSFFNFNFNRPDRGNRRFRADFNGQFRQGIYSDDTAQYVVGAGANLSYRLGRDTSANLRYNYLRPEGFAPLSIDRTGKSHLVSTDVNFRPQRYLLFGAQTGFDFLRAKTQDVGWQQVGIRSEFTPTNFFNLRALSTYDTVQGIWSSVRLDLNYRPGATLLSIGARYDGFRKSWSNANLYLNNLKMGRTSLSAILSYNGFTKRFDAQQYSFVYDLHCFEAVVNVSDYGTGFRAGKEIQFFLRLKALPFDSLFGIGRRGQPLGTGTGRDF
jgi:LPS-assembly protein